MDRPPTQNSQNFVSLRGGLCPTRQSPGRILVPAFVFDRLYQEIPTVALLPRNDMVVVDGVVRSRWGLPRRYAPRNDHSIFFQGGSSCPKQITTNEVTF